MNQWDTSVDCGAGAGLRLDRKVSIHQFETFLHAGKAESTAPHCSVDIKAKTGIVNFQMKGTRGGVKFNLKFLDMAVFHGVVERLLQDPEQAK